MSVAWRLPKRLPTASRMGTWGLVFAFALTSLGLPLEEWIVAATSSSSAPETACAIVPGATCQCSPARRRAGRCCCSLGKKVSVPKTTGCCAQRTVSQADGNKSSCAKKSPSTIPKQPSVTSCGCGSEQIPGFLWSGEPRVITRPVRLTSVEEPRAELEWGDDAPLGARPRPDVPPPRDQLLSV